MGRFGFARSESLKAGGGALRSSCDQPGYRATDRAACSSAWAALRSSACQGSAPGADRRGLRQGSAQSADTHPGSPRVCSAPLLRLA